MLSQRARLLGELLAEFIKGTAAILGRPLCRVQRLGHGPELLHLGTEFVLRFLDSFQPAVEAGR